MPKRRVVFAVILTMALGAQSAPADEVVPVETPDQSLKTLNGFLASIGASTTRIDPKLVETARKHTEYIKQNGKVAPSPEEALQLHYQVEGKPGFFGKHPQDQAKAMGFSPSDRHYVGNTVTYISNRAPLMATFLRQFTTSGLHRTIVVNPHIEAVGWYADRGPRVTLLVFFYSQIAYPEQAQTIRYPAKGAVGVPRFFQPEAPLITGNDFEAGFPITVQFLTPGEMTPVIVSQSLKTKAGKDVPVYARDASGPAGEYFKGYRLVALVPKDPLAASTSFVVALKVKDQKTGKILIDDSWSFSTNAETMEEFFRGSTPQ